MPLSNRPRRWLRAAPAALAVVAYGVFLLAHRTEVVGGADTSGYANTARSLRAGRISVPVQGLDELGLPDRFGPALTPLGYLAGPRPRTMVPFYPPGLPLHVAAASLLWGADSGLYLVSPLAAVACLLLMFSLGRELGLPRPWAAAGAAILGACPVFLFGAVQPMSDVVATLWSLAAVVAALRARRRASWAWAAGVALGVAVLVRPTSALLILPLALAVRWRPRTLALFLAGGLPCALFFLLWNRAVTGAVLETGYGSLLGEGLALARFGPRFHHYLVWVTAQLSPLIPLGWLAVAADRQVPGRDRLMLLGWFAAFLGLYCFWIAYDTWWYTRFLLPALPAMIVAALLVGRDLLGRLPRRGAFAWIRPALPLALLAVVLGAEWACGRVVRPIEAGTYGHVFLDGARALARQTGRQGGKEKALVLSSECSGAVRFFNGLASIRWDLISPADFATVQARAVANRYSIYALLLRQEVEEARRHAPGRWLPVERVEGGAVLWKLDTETTGRCPGGAAPALETCNGMDDDCDGIVDDIPRTAYSEVSVPLAAFRAKNPGCAPVDDATWLACNNAVHLLCRDVGCRTSGVGALEWGAGGAATVACLTADPPREVAAAALGRFGACPSAAGAISDRFSCGGAVHAYCRSLGYESGFGPVAAPEQGIWSVVCVKAGHARAVPTTYGRLETFHGSCASRASAVAHPGYCMTAAKRLCVDSGYVAGFGPVADPDGRSPIIVCLDE